MLTRLPALALFALLAALAPTRASAQDGDLDGGAMLAGGLGVLGAGLALDGLLVALGDDSMFEGSNGEGGLVLALPPVMVAGGLHFAVGGLASLLGADVGEAAIAGGLVNLVFAAALTGAAIAVGVDPDVSLGDFSGEAGAGILGAHAGVALVAGLTGIIAGASR